MKVIDKKDTALLRHVFMKLIFKLADVSADCFIKTLSPKSLQENESIIMGYD